MWLTELAILSSVHAERVFGGWHVISPLHGGRPVAVECHRDQCSEPGLACILDTARQQQQPSQHSVLAPEQAQTYT